MWRRLVLASVGLAALAASAAGQDAAAPSFADRARLEPTTHANGIFSAMLPKACAHFADPGERAVIASICSRELDGRQFRDIPRDERIVVAAELFRRSALRGLTPRQAALAMIGRRVAHFAEGEAEIDCLVNAAPGEQAGAIAVIIDGFAPYADPPALRALFTCGLERADGAGELIIATAWLFFGDGIIARLQGLSSRRNLPAMLALHEAMRASFKLDDASQLK